MHNNGSVFIVFYDNFLKLSNEIGKSPSAVALECGLSKPTVTRWKNGGKPTDATLQKLAEYFDVSVDYLLTGEKKEPAQLGADQEVAELLEYYRTRPEMKLLFSVTKNASPESIKRAAAIVEALEREENSEG